MKILAIDTSGASASIGLCKDTKVAEVQVASRESASSELLPAIENLLQTLEMNIEEVDAFGISLGPGSFTGLRVGMAFVKGIALPDRKPVVGISSHEAIAEPIEDHQRIAIATRARRGYVYFSVLEKSDQGLQKVKEAEEIPLSSVVSKIGNAQCIVGSGIREDEEVLRQSLPDAVTFLNSRSDVPKGKILVELTRSKLDRSEILDLDSAEPFYLMPSMAEQKAKERSK